MLLCFSNSILAHFLLGESLIQDFLHHQHLLLATLCWYCVFYSPLDLLGRLIQFLPFRLVIGIGKEIQRTRKIYDGVRSTLAVYPDAYLVIILIGAVKGTVRTARGKRREGAFQAAVDPSWRPSIDSFAEFGYLRNMKDSFHHCKADTLHYLIGLC